MMERLACLLVGHDRIKMPFGWGCGTCGYEHHRTEAATVENNTGAAVTTKVKIKVEGVCCVRRHMRTLGGNVYLDYGGAPIVMQPGQELELTVITASNGERSFFVVEEGDGEIRMVAALGAD